MDNKEDMKRMQENLKDLNLLYCRTTEEIKEIYKKQDNIEEKIKIIDQKIEKSRKNLITSIGLASVALVLSLLSLVNSSR